MKNTAPEEKWKKHMTNLLEKRKVEQMFDVV